MDTIQAAILLSKMEILDKELKLRNEVADKYTNKLRKLEEDNKLILPFVEKESNSSFAQYTIATNEREKLKEYLTSKSIPVAVHYPKTLYVQKAFAHIGYKQGDFPISENASRNVLSLPFDPYKSEEEIELVCSEINKFFQS